MESTGAIIMRVIASELSFFFIQEGGLILRGMIQFSWANFTKKLTLPKTRFSEVLIYDICGNAAV